MSSPPPQPLAQRIRGAVSGLATVDALGGPVEFHPRGTFPHTTEMQPNANFELGKGYWTDDTSMALCLAESLVENEGRCEVVDQVRKYNAWHISGHLSSTGYCFDIGVSTRAALARWSAILDSHPPSSATSVGSNDSKHLASTGLADIRTNFSSSQYCGNGSLMRTLPAALCAESLPAAVECAHSQSLTTHPHPRCTSACELYTTLVHLCLDGQHDQSDLVRAITDFKYADETLRDTLLKYPTLDTWKETPPSSIKSSGYVLHTIEASLWSFFSTSSFEDGAIRAVNLGDDADTVGAIYGGLAGAYYGFDGIPRRWVDDLQRRDLLDGVIRGILKMRKVEE